MKFLNDLENHLRSKFAAYPAESVLALEACPAGQSGDFTLNCFRIGKFCGNPMAAAAEVVDFLQKHEDIAEAGAVKAFVNLSLKTSAL